LESLARTITVKQEDLARGQHKYRQGREGKLRTYVKPGQELVDSALVARQKLRGRHDGCVVPIVVKSRDTMAGRRADSERRELVGVLA
jgi:hypothetical protein